MVDASSTPTAPATRQICATEGTHKAALDLVRLPAGSTILDIGCYEGAISSILLKRGYQVKSCDRHPYPGSDSLPAFQIVDANHGLPYADASVDGIFCTEVIEHLENPTCLIRECSRTLKPGGICVLSTPNTSSFFNRLAYLLRGEFLLFRKYHFDNWGHISPISFNWLHYTAEKYGLQIDAITGDQAPMGRRKRVLLVVGWPVLLLRQRLPLSAYLSESLVIRLRKAR